MVQIFVNDWMTSMGSVALMRIDSDNIIKKDANSIEVPKEWFASFPEKLFQYFIHQYSVSNREFIALKKIISGLQKQENNKERYKSYVKSLNDRIKGNLDRIKKYFPQYEEQLISIVEQIKLLIEQKDFEGLSQQIQLLFEIMKTPEIDQKLTLNWVKATILSPAAGQASFLNVAKNGLAYKEQKTLFHKDYVQPVLWEITLRERWLEGNEEEIEALFKVNEKPDYATKWESAKKKSKLSWCEWLTLLPECGLLEGQWGTIMFEEMHFVPLGMSMSNAYNYSWDGNLQSVQSISSLAKLLLLISPIGAIRYKRPSQSDEINVFGFLHYESSCEKTFILNNQLASSMNKEVRFSNALKDSFAKVRELEKKRKEALMLIEWDTDYKAKKTFLSYKPLNAEFVEYLMNEKSSITGEIYPYEFREKIVRAALDNIDSKHLIIKEMRRLMDEINTKRFTKSIKNALLMREHLLNIKEDKRMGAEKLITTQMYGLGYKIAKKLTGSRQDNEDGSYQATNEKKLTSIAYRLLNTAKSGNRQLFFDTAVRLHISANMNISSNFTKLLDPNTSDKEFATIALAFVAGLIPADTVSEIESKEVTNQF